MLSKVQGPPAPLFDGNPWLFEYRGFKMIEALDTHFAKSSNTAVIDHLLALCAVLQGPNKQLTKLMVKMEEHFSGLHCGCVLLPNKVKVMFVLASLNDHY